jgi:hypothetical protein
MARYAAKWAFAAACWLAFGTATCSAQLATSTTLGVSTISGTHTLYRDTYESPGALPATLTDPYGATVSESFDLPSVEATVATTMNALTQAFGFINYQVAVVGPGTLAVPLLVDGNYKVIGDDASTVTASFDVYYGSTFLDQFAAQCLAGGTNNNCGSGSYAGSFNVPVGLSEFQVQLTASANTTLPGVGDAMIDPFIRIDPAFAAAHPEYSLVFPSGVGNGLPVPVPEPATWVLALTGLAVLRMKGRAPVGARVTRRRTKGSLQ